MDKGLLSRKPVKHPDFRLFQREDSIVGSINGIDFYALPEPILYILSKCDGKTTLGTIMMDIVKQAPEKSKDVAGALGEAVVFLTKVNFIELKD